MLRRTSLILALSVSAASALADTPVAPRPLDSAMHAMRRGDWNRAHALAERDGPVARVMIDWFRLSGGASPAEVMDFAEKHPGWPGLSSMRRRAEDGLDSLSDDEVLIYFKDEAPQTGAGVLRLAQAQIANGMRGEAEASVVLAWRTMNLSTKEHDSFIRRFGDLLSEHHDARMDYVLWRSWRNDIEAMRPLVSSGMRALADAREALERDSGNLDALIKAVPEALQTNGGLAYERFVWRLNKKLRDSAVELLLAQSRIAGGLGLPDRWGSWRRSIARSEMRAGNAQLAYDIASVHQLTEGSNYADLEWLSGYLCLRKLDDPACALKHFERFREAVFTPISIGRAGYWTGLAHEALGNPEAAQRAYLEAAGHQTSFYGLLAAEKAGVPFDLTLGGHQDNPPWQQASFAGGELQQAIALALAVGDLSLAERFTTALADTLEPAEMAQLGDMLEELDAPHLGVMLGKAAARREIVLPAAYYALHPLHKTDLSIAPEMALAIARRESEFDPRVVSSVGAQGLMQLMPATAREVASDLGLTHRPAAVLGDWRYNATLGSAYLAGLARRFDGNVVMMSAGYNAGPGRPIQWMRSYGDPRRGEVDIVDWIEHIPFRETQNYVMRVAESLPIYRARLGKEPLPVPFSQELTGSTLKPLSP